LTTKIHALTDALGRPLRFILTGGEAHDSTTAADLLVGYTSHAVIADKAYDNNALRKLIADAGAQAVIPSLSFRAPIGRMLLPIARGRRRSMRFVIIAMAAMLAACTSPQQRAQNECHSIGLEGWRSVRFPRAS